MSIFSKAWPLIREEVVLPNPRNSMRGEFPKSSYSRPMPQIEPVLTENYREWFKGFCDGLGDEPPTKEQWNLIKEKLLGTDGVA